MRTRLTMIALITIMLFAGLVPSAAVAQTTPTVSTSSLIVKVVAGLTADQQAAIVGRNGGTVTSSIAALRLLVVSMASKDVDAALARYLSDPQVQNAELNKTRVSEAAPTDPLYSSQWALGKIGWDQVFGIVTPGGSAKVAVLDTGVDASHPELAGKVLSGISILDTSNGMTDPSGHGTWLAGIIAAQTNTIPGEGIAAVAHAGVEILPVTVLNSNGEGQDSDVIAGVIWAADHGADVILMAFSAPEFSQNLQHAIDYAWSKNAVVVAAVGNDAGSTPTFPAGDRGVMGVAATDQNDGLASFSNAGQGVFIAAPGVAINTIDIHGNYIVVSGTSAAAAHVAGLAALMKAVNPSLSNGVIVSRIARNADPAGTQDETGNGRINMPRALADTSTEFVEPAGSAPVGNGGPFVGPYREAAIQTITTIASSLNPSGFGQSVTFTGTASCDSCTFTVGQTLSFVENANNSCNGGTTLSSGNVLSVTNNGTPTATARATFTTSALTSGTHAIRACLVGGGGGNPNPQNSNSDALNQVVNAATKLAITSVNGGTHPTFGTPFSVVVQSQTSSSIPTTVAVATTFSLTVTTGTGSIGTVNGTIAAGTSSVTISSINYSKAENNVVLTATRTSGDPLSPGSSAPFNVLQATSITTVTCPAGVTYTGAAQTPCTVSVTGAGSLSLTPSATYTDNTNVGTATASYTFTGDADHTGSSDSKNFTIDKASSTTVVSCPASVVYTGSPQTPCTVSVTGAGGLNLTPMPTYANNTNAGTATASYSFTGDANHNGSSDSKDFTIEKAPSITVVTCPASVVYTGSPQTPCTVSVTGAGGLNLTPLPTYANNTNAGTATASYTFTGDANHNGSSDSKNFTIEKAPSITVVSCPASVTYNGLAQTPCTAAVTGVGGLSQTLAVNHTNNTNAGTAMASATYAGDSNHDGSTDTKYFTIDKASSTTVVSCPASVLYTGSPVQPCSASVTGAGGLNQALGVSYTNNTNVGTATGSATYAGDANHTDSSDSKTFFINLPPIVSDVNPSVVPANTAFTVTAKVDDTTTGGSTVVSAQYTIINGPLVVVAPTPMAACGTSACTTAGSFDKPTVFVRASLPSGLPVGVYEICVSGTDVWGDSSELTCSFLAVYDPNAGFVTGGGWINSPLGASTQYPDAVGKANFGFTSKYLKGAKTPTGETEFQFKAGNLNFHSQGYEWLVISGARAQYKGTGTINGAGNYGFMLTAIDGGLLGGGQPDRFRIKIWDNNANDEIVYDNQMGYSDTSDAATAVGGGSIQIKTK
jgi:subtilisin family serine protease